MRPVKQLVPWQAKVGLKLALSNLPVSYARWRQLGVFRYGEMQSPTYALGVARKHLARFERDGSLAGCTVLELGPGDSVSSALITTSLGIRETYLVDTGAFAETDVANYVDVEKLLRDEGLEPPSVRDFSSVADLLRACGATYLTEGLASLRELPSASLDFAWSHAVLEHVRRHEFLPTMVELCRLLKPGASASHRVDLTDHLGGGLNNLRFSSGFWERERVATAGFYTNRLRLSEMESLLREAGFEVELLGRDEWASSPLPPRKLHREFAHLSPDDLRVSGFDCLLRRPRQLAD